jgi:hypothetical protein
MSYVGTSVTLVESVTLSWSFSSITYIEFIHRTYSPTVVSTIVITILQVPVYVRTVVPIKFTLVVSPTQDHPTLGTGGLLAVVSGCASIVAVLVGIVVFIVRHKGDSKSTYNGDDRSQDDTAVNPSGRVTNEEPRPDSLIPKDASDGPKSLSSCGEDGCEDPGLYV